MTTTITRGHPTMYHGRATSNGNGWLLIVWTPDEQVMIGETFATEAETRHRLEQWCYPDHITDLNDLTDADLGIVS